MEGWACICKIKRIRLSLIINLTEICLPNTTTLLSTKNCHVTREISFNSIYNEQQYSASYYFFIAGYNPVSAMSITVIVRAHVENRKPVEPRILFFSSGQPVGTI